MGHGALLVIDYSFHHDMGCERNIDENNLMCIGLNSALALCVYGTE